MEIESALVAHAKVAEAAVVGRPDDLTGTAIVAFVTPKQGTAVGREFANALRDHVAHQIGGIAKPADVRFTDALPKTRSGKIMRRLLRDIASGSKTVGDTTTLEDFSVIAKLQEHREEA
jgi:acetyl-CoA synthetase